MAIQCFTRAENNGIHVIFPVEGPMKQNCLLVNDTVRFVFDLVRGGAPLSRVRTAFVERAEAEYRRALAAWKGDDEETKPKEPARRTVLFDLYRILLNLKDHGICEYGHADLRQLLPQGTELRGASQIMPVSAIAETAAFLGEAMSGNGAVRVFYSVRALENLPRGYFLPENVTRRHLGREEVYFIDLDEAGEVDACTIVAGFGIQPHSLTATFIAGRHRSEDEFRETIGRHFARVCGLLSIVTLSAMIRLPVLTGQAPNVYLHEDFLDLIGELGFRKSLDLPDELGPGAGLVAYDKTLF